MVALGSKVHYGKELKKLFNKRRAVCLYKNERELLSGNSSTFKKNAGTYNLYLKWYIISIISMYISFYQNLWDNEIQTLV